jgi:hypothetical protein
MAVALAMAIATAVVIAAALALKKRMVMAMAMEKRRQLKWEHIALTLIASHQMLSVTILMGLAIALVARRLTLARVSNILMRP